MSSDLFDVSDTSQEQLDDLIETLPLDSLKELRQELADFDGPEITESELTKLVRKDLEESPLAPIDMEDDTGGEWDDEPNPKVLKRVLKKR